MPGERFHVRLLPEDGGDGDPVVVEVGMEGFNVLSRDGKRPLRKYPLHHISRWSVRGIKLILFTKSPVDAEDRRVTLESDEGTIRSVLDTLTSSCMQTAELLQGRGVEVDAAAIEALGALLTKTGKAAAAALPTSDEVEFWKEPEKVGWMQSQGEHIRTWRRRWFVLKSGFLFRFSNEQSVKPGAKPRGVVDLSRVTEVGDGRPATGRPASITLSTSTGSTSYICDSETSSVEWASALEGAVAKVLRVVAGVEDAAAPASAARGSGSSRRATGAPASSSPASRSRPAGSSGSGRPSGPVHGNGLITVVNYAGPSAASGGRSRRDGGGGGGGSRRDASPADDSPLRGRARGGGGAGHDAGYSVGDGGIYGAKPFDDRRPAGGSNGGSQGYGGTNGGPQGYGDNAYSGSAQQGGYGSQQGGYGSQQGGYGTQQTGYGAQQTGYGAQQTGYGAQQTGYGAQQTGYGAQQTGYGAQQSGYGAADTGPYGQQPQSHAAYATAAATQRAGQGQDYESPSQHGYAAGYGSAAPAVPQQQGWGGGVSPRASQPQVAAGYGGGALPQQGAYAPAPSQPYGNYAPQGPQQMAQPSSLLDDVTGQQPSPAPAAAPTASPWQTHVAPDGRPYYYNSQTGVTQWEPPQ